MGLVKIDITPKSGNVILFGTYVWENDGSSEEFHLELKWITDGRGLVPNKVIWINDLTEKEKTDAEIDIYEAYNSLNKKITIIFRDEEDSKI